MELKQRSKFRSPEVTVSPNLPVKRRVARKRSPSMSHENWNLKFFMWNHRRDWQLEG